jgi:hypothetical protein
MDYAPGYLVELASAGGRLQQVSTSPDRNDLASFEQMLIGFYVDDVEKPALFALYDGEDYLVPLRRVLADTGAELVDREGRLVLVSPGGEVVVPRERLRDFEGTLMIERAALSELLLMEARFDAQAYALFVYPPWWQGAAPVRGARPTITPHFSPPSASLRNMRGDFSYISTDDGSDSWAQYYLAGNLARGYWSTRAEEDINNDYRVFDYRWQREWEHSQLLLGNARFSVHPLAPTVDQTGAQLLWNSRASAARQASGLGRTRASREIGSGTRTISGVGEPGAIAELRLEGSVVARTRVRLDGTFEFIDVDIPTRGYRNIQVLVLDRNSGTLLEQLDYSSRGGVGVLSAGQHTVFASLGGEGNLLDSDVDSRGTAGALQWRYGISDRLTAEISQQSDGEDNTSVVAASASLGNSWFGSLAYASGADEAVTELVLDAGRDAWQFDLMAREYDVDRVGEPSSQWVRQVDYRYSVSRNLVLGLAGRDSRTLYEDESFLLPTLSWGNGRTLWASAWPNTDGNYRIDSRFTPSARDTLRYTVEEDNHFFDYRHRGANGIEYYSTYREGEDLAGRLEVGLILRTEQPMLEQAQLGLVANDGGDPGYTIQWDARPVQGVYSRLRVSDQAQVNATRDSDTGFTVQWDITLDYAVSAGRVIPADSSLGGFGSAALVGDILVDFPGHVELNAVNRISLIVDGVSYTARVQDGKYYVDGLEPGIHRVSLDSRYLPIELSPASGQQYWVMLESSAATEVPFQLEVGYAVAGKISVIGGEPVRHARVAVLNEQGRRLQTVYTDEFGLYRIDRLPPGRYRIIVEQDGLAIAARAVNVVDDFLFEQDIRLPARPSES